MPFTGIKELTVGSDQIGIAITKGAFGGHVGIAFNPPNKDLSLLHLAWHLDLRVELVNDSNFCWAATILEIPALAAKQVVALVHTVAAQPPAIPYGINLLGAFGSFDSIGRYTPGPNSDGLTCSTFVAVLLAGIGVRLVDEDTWPRADENFAWGQEVINFLRKYATPKHVERVQQSNLGLRLHPFELAAAAERPSAERPIKYAEAHSQIERIANELEAVCKET